MVNTVLNILFPDGVHAVSHQFLMPVLDEAHHLLCSQLLEPLLELAEDQLDWVVLRSIADIENVPEAKSSHLIEALL